MGFGDDALDSDEVVDYGDKTPLIPGGQGRTLFSLDELIHYASENEAGKAWWIATLTAIATTNNLVTVGREYKRMLSCPSNSRNKAPRAKEMRNFVCAVEGINPNDPDVRDVGKRRDDLLNASARSEGLDRYLWVEVDSTRDVAQDDGTTVSYANYRYTSATEADVLAALESLSV